MAESLACVCRTTVQRSITKMEVQTLICEVAVQGRWHSVLANNAWLQRLPICSDCHSRMPWQFYPLFGHACANPPTSSRNFSGYHGPPMNRERRGEPWTAELSDDIDNPRVVGSLPDEPTKV